LSCLCQCPNGIGLPTFQFSVLSLTQVTSLNHCSREE
jgi:hypothetical protein